ncbi:MAG: ISNCY family transposase [Armatimonadota bacterium]|jgi:transposase
MGSGVKGIGIKQISRHHVLGMVQENRITLKEASQILGVSYRHVKRLKEDFDKEGIKGLVHGNIGRSPANKIDDDLKTQVIALSKEKYHDFNDTHFTEMLKCEEHIELSRECVRTIRRGAGIKAKHKRKPPKHFKRRARKANEGLMMLWDGSPHRWFGKDMPACCLMAAIDDATSKVVGLFFCEAECSWAYLELLRRVIDKHGIPLSTYQDRHSALKRNDSFWSIEEELAGRQDPTQVGAALEALGIEPIDALTPQAKGRVERLFKTLQDRLVAQLRLKGITDIEAANKYLDETFVDDLNSNFSVAAQNAQSAWRKPARGCDLARVLSLKYEAIVGNDKAIRYAGMIIDVAPGPKQRSYAGVKVQMCQMLDGSWRVYYNDAVIATAPPTDIAEPIRAKNRRKGVRAARESKWVYLASAQEPDKGTVPAHKAKPTARRAGTGRTINATRIA